MVRLAPVRPISRLYEDVRIQRTALAALVPGAAMTVPALALWLYCFDVGGGESSRENMVRLALTAGLWLGGSLLWTLALAYDQALGNLWAAWREVFRRLPRVPSEGIFSLPAPPPEDYRFIGEDRAGRAPQAAAQAVRAPVLIASGSFQVERSKALEKLQGFQLGDPDGFLIPWIRCAAASGATRIHLVRLDRGLRMIFDGRPIPPETVKDPYGPLFSDEEDRSPGRHLAVGLLAAVGLAPSSVTIASGEGARRVRLEIGEATLKPGHRGRDAMTVLEVSWKGLGALLRRERCLAAAVDAVAPNGPILELDGTAVQSWTPRARLETEDALVGELASTGRPGIRLYAMGALVEELPWPEGPKLFEVRIGHPKFKLNISQSGVVRDQAFEQALELAALLAEELRKSGNTSPPPAVAGTAGKFLRGGLQLGIVAAAGVRLAAIYVPIPAARWIHLDHTPEVFVGWLGAFLFLAAALGVWLTLAAHRALV